MLLGHKVTVGFDVLAKRAGVCVALQAAHHLAIIRLVHVVCACVFEAIAGVGVAFVTTLVWTDVGLLTCREKEDSSVLSRVNNTSGISRRIT